MEAVSTNSAGIYTSVFILGKTSNPKDREEIRTYGASVFKEVRAGFESITVNGESTEGQFLFLEGAALASYKFDKYLSDKKKAKLKSIYTSNKKVKLDALKHIVDATCWARTLVNEPVSYLTAEQLSKDISSKCKGTGIKVEVFGKSKIESLKMGGLLAVNKGSIDPPTFTILEWKPKNAKNKKPIVLVGKGIVYDTGGLSLKTNGEFNGFL